MIQWIKWKVFNLLWLFSLFSFYSYLDELKSNDKTIYNKWFLSHASVQKQLLQHEMLQLKSSYHLALLFINIRQHVCDILVTKATNKEKKAQQGL